MRSLVGSVRWNDSDISYVDNTFIIMEKREGEDEIRTEFNEDDFRNYMTDKGENPHDVSDMVDILKEEAKIASLVKYAKSTMQYSSVIPITITMDDTNGRSELRDIYESNLSDADKEQKASEVIHKELTAKILSAISTNEESFKYPWDIKLGGATSVSPIDSEGEFISKVFDDIKLESELETE